MTDEEEQQYVDESKPWYRRSMAGKIVTGAAIFAVGSLTVWLASVILGAATVEQTVQANTDDISAVEETLNEDLMPVVQRIDQRTRQTKDMVQSLESELDKVEKRQYEQVSSP